MLSLLHIENYALIRESDITFNDGFIVITGETGAGKSILLGALSLLLGQRADMQVLQDKQKKCVVEAHWHIEDLSLQSFFEINDLDYDDTLIIRREILPSGKSRAFVNDTPITLSILTDLGHHLIDIHSQHQTLTLTNSKFQISLLDILSNDPNLVNIYGISYSKYTSLKRELETLVQRHTEQAKEFDFIQFQYNELYEAKLNENEQEELEEELSLLSNMEAIKETLATIDNLCYSDENGAITRLRMCRSQISHISSFHKDFDDLHQRLDSSIIEIEDILHDFDSINNQLSYSPERLQSISERLDLIYRLQKKHSLSSISDLLNYQEQLQERILSYSTLDDHIQKAMSNVDSAFVEVQQLATKLTQLRTESAVSLQKQISPILAQLGMKDSCIQVKIYPANDFNNLGQDAVSFLFNANKGGEPRELSKVASGGEMSRLMLAIKSLITQKNMLPTIIFDEIDTGISGDISVSVGNIMSSMSSTMQVIAISHMPQIAAKANQHLKVYKQNEENLTISSIRQISEEERVSEIAVMLSSDPPTPSAMQTARELMLKN